jgi:hypothetical protein
VVPDDDELDDGGLFVELDEDAEFDEDDDEEAEPLSDDDEEDDAAEDVSPLADAVASDFSLPLASARLSVR